MLTRFAATLFSLALASTAVAGTFAQPPSDTHAVRFQYDPDVTIDRNTVRAALAASRAHHLASFRAYRNVLTSGFTIEEIDRIQAPMVEAPLENEQTRMAEIARLAKLYEDTERYLVKHEKAGLDLAVDRLMTRPDLAEAVVGQYLIQTTKFTSRPAT
jgi:hypothetical protein